MLAGSSGTTRNQPEVGFVNHPDGHAHRSVNLD
jgi:hypothetical protein